MGRYLIYEALNKANKNRNMYSVEFCFLTGLVAAAGSEGDFWWLRGPQETQARVAIKPLWVVFLTISKGPWASSSWFQALLSAPPAADLIGFSVQGQPEPAHSLAWNPSPTLGAVSGMYPRPSLGQSSGAFLWCTVPYSLLRLLSFHVHRKKRLLLIAISEVKSCKVGGLGLST